LQYRALRKHESNVTLSTAVLARPARFPRKHHNGERMTQRTRNIMANVLLGVAVLTVVVFIATHFMSPARPSWRRDLVFLGLACVIASRPVRGGPRRGTAQSLG
jgi:hypothetical protein